MNLTEHFALEELVPAGTAAATPADVVANLAALATDLLEPVRVHAGVPVIIHDAYRPPGVNIRDHGVPTSDHLTGRAADFHVSASAATSWEAATFAAFEFVRTQLRGQFGQAILEDHRKALADPRKLWVHVSIPTTKHPGTNDADAVLLSLEPMHYTVLTDDMPLPAAEA